MTQICGEMLTFAASLIAQRGAHMRGMLIKLTVASVPRYGSPERGLVIANYLLAPRVAFC
jgi:hypothetical protein